MKREYLYWEYQHGKQQAVRMGPWKGIRFGGTKEPIELYNLDRDIGEKNNVAEDHPDIIKSMGEIMQEARQESMFTGHYPLPEYRRMDIKLDTRIINTLGKGEDL